MRIRLDNHNHRPDPMIVLITLLIANAGAQMAQQLNITTEAIKTTPPAIVSLLHAGGMTPSDWITVLTLAYLALQIGLIVPKYLEKFRHWWERIRRGRS
ncbi:hypothetical protein [Salinicola rhizosphaerae]|uniref:Holin n=1 Tax=Salinicola rhizosphaerae TaxID=1443141 RepID=A0ABQ3EFD0_9GAMM|nr:hypothetical protein [Salinicola rhizosphaerae]GHB32848.1 hypothetical protein GCM10009038_34720 [Salinicola rhizosphaerae]